MRGMYLHQNRLRLAVAIFSLVAIIIAPPAAAGVWKGDVTHKGSPVAGAMVTICGASATTNSSGSFKVAVQGNPKRCSVRVKYQGKASSAVKVRSSPYLSLSLRSGSSGWVVEVK